MKSHVLVLCTGNSARSQMLHGFLEQDPELEVASAGVAPKGVHPQAAAAMAEVGVDISHHTSEHVDRYVGDSFDLVVTVCDNAREACPTFPGARRMLHRSFADPAGHGDRSAETAAFSTVRDQLREFAGELRLRLAAVRRP